MAEKEAEKFRQKELRARLIIFLLVAGVSLLLIAAEMIGFYK